MRLLLCDPLFNRGELIH